MVGGVDVDESVDGGKGSADLVSIVLIVIKELHSLTNILSHRAAVSQKLVPLQVDQVAGG